MKLCGLRRVAEVRLAAELGAWACGFVFHPGSPRYLPPAEAAVLSREAEGLVRVGVFVHQGPEQILRIAERVGLDGVQLHRPWREEEVARLAREGLQVIGLIRPPLPAPHAARESPVRPDLFLLEPAAGGEGGTGAARDWAALRESLGGRRPPGPFFLAGGLTPENVAVAVGALNPDGVDVSSGIEARRGVKDLNRMRAFMERVGEIDAAAHRA